MNYNHFVFGVSVLALNLLGVAATHAQQPQVSEPDAPATAARPTIQAPSVSGVPHEIKFNAILRDSSGKPLTGTVAVSFSLYDQQEGGTPSWSETQNVEPDAQGRYSVLLGAASGVGLPAELFRSSDGRWLGVRVLAPGHVELPRVRWVSVPYALKAGDAETLGGRPLSSFLMAPEGQTGNNPATGAQAASNPPLASALTGTGTAGFISKFTAATTLANSIIFEKSGNIGLGTTSPVSKLSVVGNITATGSIAAGGILSLPKTTSTAVGVLNLGGVRFLHSFGSFNTFVGPSAGNMTMTGGDNTAVGDFALSGNTTGHNNASLGASALGSNTTGFSNSAFGSGAMFANSTGIRNSAFGDGALLFNTTSLDNSAFGFNAMFNNISGSFNSAFGDSALSANTTGGDNTAVGYSALLSNTTGCCNSAFGTYSLFDNTTGAHNVAVGGSTLFANTTGIRNVAFGDSALSANTVGFGNSAFGFLALSNATSFSDSNTAIGQSSLINVTNGGSNIAIGASAGSNLTTGFGNIYIGSNNGPAQESSTIRIGFIPNGGPGSTFIDGIVGQTIGSGTAVFIDNSGHLGVFTSSQRFKNDITDMAAESDLLMKLRPVSFYYKPELDDTHTRQYGLVAEEVAKIAPQLVVFDKDGAPQTVRYHFVNAMLLNEVQKQRSTIEDLTARLAKLEALLPTKP